MRAPMQELEGMDKYVTAEMCQTTNRHWGIAEKDLDYKNPRQLIERLCHARKVGANYLLNIGPTGTGAVTKITEALLEIVGKWTDMAKESLYEGRPTDIVCNHEKDFVLKKGNTLYAYVHDLPLLGPKDVVVAYESTEEGHTLKGVKGKVRSMHWIDNDEELIYSQEGDEVSFRATGFYYGTHWIVRVAKIELE